MWAGCGRSGRRAHGRGVGRGAHTAVCLCAALMCGVCECVCGKEVGSS